MMKRELTIGKKISRLTYQSTRSIRKALSLLEVMISLAILAVAVAILSQTMFLASNNGIRSKEMMAAELLCESTMAEVIAGIIPLDSTGWTPIGINSVWHYLIETIAVEQPNMIGVRITVTDDPQRTSANPIDFQLVRLMIDPTLGLDSPQSQTTPSDGSATSNANASTGAATGGAR